MNCKPGDLALVRAPRSGGFCPALGHWVTVVGASQQGEIVPLPDGRRTRKGGEWVIEFASEIDLTAEDGRAVRSKFWTMWDSRLKPIRDPGDDAQDETLQWLPVPSRDEVSA
jgi:hypothetical protein